jgi:hypothetical protein
LASSFREFITTAQTNSVLGMHPVSPVAMQPGAFLQARYRPILFMDKWNETLAVVG